MLSLDCFESDIAIFFGIPSYIDSSQPLRQKIYDGSFFYSHFNCDTEIVQRLKREHPKQIIFPRFVPHSSWKDCQSERERILISASYREKSKTRLDFSGAIRHAAFLSFSFACSLALFFSAKSQSSRLRWSQLSHHRKAANVRSRYRSLVETSYHVLLLRNFEAVQYKHRKIPPQYWLSVLHTDFFLYKSEISNNRENGSPCPERLSVWNFHSLSLHHFYCISQARTLLASIDVILGIVWTVLKVQKDGIHRKYIKSWAFQHFCHLTCTNLNVASKRHFFRPDFRSALRLSSQNTFFLSIFCCIYPITA